MPASASMAIMSPSLTERDRAADSRLRPEMADAEAARAAGEPPVGHQRHVLAHALAVDGGGRCQHLAHARPAAWALVADHQDFAGLVVAPQHGGEAVFLRFEDAGRTGERASLPGGATLQIAPSGASEPFRPTTPPLGENGFLAGRQDVLACRDRDVSMVLRQRRAGDGEAVAMPVAAVEQGA